MQVLKWNHNKEIFKKEKAIQHHLTDFQKIIISALNIL